VTPSGSLSPEARSPWWRAEPVVILALWTLIGVLFTTSIHLARIASGEPKPFIYAVRIAAVDVYTWAAVTLAVFALVHRFPLERGRWVSRVPVYAVAGLALVVARALTLHTIVQTLQWHPPRTVAQAIYSFVAPNFVTFWMLAGVAHALEYFRRYRDREVQSAHLEGQLAQAQLQMLKMQLHPHFLFNTLHAISTLVHRDPDTAERMIASLSELLRTTLAREKAQEVTVREELEFLAPYLEIEQTRFGERLDVRVEVEEGAAGAMIPHLILQPLVENAIRHGVAPRREGGRVEIAALRENGHLRLRVRDNGRGMRGPEGMGRPGGIGLPNTRARLEQLYGARQRLEVSTAPGEGTEIEITIPFRSPEPA
jgi:two-component system LytT family sensor kinase